jgi:ketosteroid isomerase-like protein
MMKHIPAWGVGLTLFLSGLCICLDAAESAGHLAPREAIRKVLDDQAAAWNRGDIDGFMLGYWNSPELIFTSGGNVRRGWQVTTDQYRKSYPDRARMGELIFSDLEIHLLNAAGQKDREASSAWVLGKWRLKRATDEPHGLFTLILQKFPSETGHDGGWKIVHDHTSSSPENPSN